ALLDLGPTASPPCLEFASARRRLVEVALLPTFPLAAGAFVDGARWRMDERAWEWFYRGRYFVRAVDLEDANVRRSWSFVKSSFARTAPLEPRELEPAEGSRA